MWKHGKLWEGVPSETAGPLEASEKKVRMLAFDRQEQTAKAFSTTERPSPWNRMRKRCVSCVPSSVSSVPSSGFELRTAVPRSVALAYPQKSPKDTLKSVFERLKRTARTKKFARMAERFAPRDPLVQRLRQEGSAFPFQTDKDLVCSGRRVTVSVKSMRYEETSWRSLQDVVGVVLATTKNGLRAEDETSNTEKALEMSGKRAASRKKH